MRFDQLRRPRKNVDVAFLFATPAAPSHSRGLMRCDTAALSIGRLRASYASKILKIN
jgi:hypothetical protein